MNEINKQAAANAKTIAELVTGSAVVVRDISYMRNEIDKIATKLDEMAKNFATKDDLKEMDGRITQLEETKNWLAKIIIGAVVAALLAFLGLR